MRNRAVTVIGIGMFLAFGLASYAQPPRVLNAQIILRSAAAGLNPTVQSLLSNQNEPLWIGYSIPIIPGEHYLCCYSWEGSSRSGGRCRLEGTRVTNVQSPGDARAVRLESGRFLLILLRAEAGTIQKIRIFTEECELDAGGLSFYWLKDVKAPESVSFLSRLVIPAKNDDRAGRSLSESAISAIAFHNDPAADQELERFVASNQPDSLREQASFWLGNARGRHGYEILARLVQEDASDRMRNSAVFALTQSKDPEALATIINVAKTDRSAQVRAQALFWLSQKAGQKSAEVITDAIENDPETEVKKKAVFALSQLLKEAGIPQLIEVAKTNSNHAVRKQAMFWLGQSGDPRALAFFEGILK